MIQWRMLRYSDLPLWGGVFCLLLFGSLSLYSTSHSNFSILLRHLISIGIALLMCAPFLFLDYRHMRWLCWGGYAISLFLLILVEFVGKEVGGSARWLILGPLSFQPSEITKIAVLCCVAQYLATRVKPIHRLEELVMILLIVGPPAFLILHQPDLGTAVILLVSVFGLVLFSGPKLPIQLFLLIPVASMLTRLNLFTWIPYLAISSFFLFNPALTGWVRWPLIGWNIASGASVPLFWQILKPYQQQRILTFLNPGMDPHGAGYQSLQSQMAIGNGGILGQGYLHGTQTQLSFVPQQTSDFIFSSIGEEWGLIGSLFLFVVLWIVCIRMLKISFEAPDRFGEMLAGGLFLLIGVQVFVNISMAMGLFPVVGVPLPFISLGGTSLMVTLMSIGILQSIAMRTNRIFF